MVTLEEIEQARDRIRGHVVVTPCSPAGALGDGFGGKAWLKFENLQRTGSFKERGALNRLLLLDPEQRRRGVVAASAGNHAQGVAYHAGRLGVPATIVMPENTPLIKVTNTAQYAATVVLHGANYDEAMEETLRRSASEGLLLLHPFDDPAVIAGQGTIGLELLEQCPGVDTIVVAVGGGGLISGIAAAVKAIRPEVDIVGVETAAIPAAFRSREAGERVTLPAAETIADGIAVRRIGELTFEMMERYVDRLTMVDEEEIASAVLLLLEREKTVVEAACATTIAAVLGGQAGELRGRNVVMLLSGGNIDVNLLSRIIDRGLVRDGRLTRLDVRLPDRPGALAGLAAVIAASAANVIGLEHVRGMEGFWLTEVSVQITLETRGHDHVRLLLDRLEAAGYPTTIR